MQEYLNRIRQQITDYWGKLSNKNRIQIVSAVAIGIIALVILGVVLSQPTMVKFKDDISASDMSAIRAALDEQGIEYKISNDASTLYVNDQKQQDASIVLADLNIISDALMTYEQATTNSLTTTQSEKTLKIQLAFEDEMNRKIELLDAVKNAYVKFYIGDAASSIFDEARPSSAAVFLELIGPLDRKAVTGIASMLKNSVPNLDPANISIQSTTGELLYDGMEAEGMAGNISSQVEYTEQAKQIIRNQITPQLLATGAYDDVSVSLTLDVDFDDVSIIDRDYEQGPIVNEYNSESTGVNTNTGGIPGTDANDGAVTYPIEGGNTSSSTDTQTEITRVADEKVTQTIKGPGKINYNNSNMSIVLNTYTYIYEDTIEKQGLLGEMTWEEYQDANGAPTMIEVPEEIVDVIQKGTSINNVSVLAYERPMFVSKPVQDIQVLSYLPIGIIILLIGLLVYAVIKGTEPMEIEETEPELSVEDMLESTKEKQVYDEIEFNDKSDKRNLIERFVDKNPDAVANLLRNWLNDDWE